VRDSVSIIFGGAGELDNVRDNVPIIFVGAGELDKVRASVFISVGIGMADVANKLHAIIKNESDIILNVNYLLLLFVDGIDSIVYN